MKKPANADYLWQVQDAKTHQVEALAMAMNVAVFAGSMMDGKANAAPSGFLRLVSITDGKNFLRQHWSANPHTTD